MPVSTSGNAPETVIDIPDNSSCGEIGELLFSHGLVRGPRLVSFYARLRGVDQDLKPGRYSFKSSQSLPEIVTALVAGPPDLAAFTVPEGFSIRQMTYMLEQRGIVNGERFKEALDAARNSDTGFLKDLPPGVGLEGYLFPDTYYVDGNTDERQIVEMMLNRFGYEIKRLDFEKKAAAVNLTLHQAVTVASLIEGEAAVDGERPLIASVIYNRLRLGMPLQIDATVKYALGGSPEKIYYKDLQVDSPYNTYRVDGLPPGPINSPGEASLLAAVNPARTDYLYYVSRRDGTHAFSSSLEEHNANKIKYQNQ